MSSGIFSGSESLSMSQVLPQVVNSLIGKIHTATIGRVDAYDASNQRADVTPLVNRVSAGGGAVKYKKLAGVPVLFPSGDGGGITYPVKRGDVGLLVFSERSTDEALASGKQETPADPRRYHLSDGFFIPGILPGSSAPRARYSDATEISCGKVRIVLRNGRVAIGIAGMELLRILSDTLQGIALATTTVAGVQVPLTNAAVFADLNVQLETIRGEL